MLKGLFHNPPPPTSRISHAIHRLGTQHANLELATVRLRRRNKALFEACISAVREGYKDRAVIYANGVVEIRKLAHIVTQNQLAIEQVLLRLETLQELGPIIKDLKSVINATHKVTGQLKTVMPKIASEMNGMSKLITETLAATTLGSTPPIKPLEEKNKESEEILQEALATTERMLLKRLPEPPAFAPESVEPKEGARQMVALASGGYGASEQRKHTTKTRISMKDRGLQQVPLPLACASRSVRRKTRRE